MRRSSALLLTLLAVTGCASQRRPSGELTVVPAPRTVVGVEVTNTFDRGIDVYYSTQFLGTLAPHAHRRYSVPPALEPFPVYARMSGYSNQINITSGLTVRYVYEDPAPTGR